MRPVPERDVLAREDVGPRLVVHARRLERDDDPVLERAHRPLDLALCLRRRGYHVVDAERAAHAPELGAEVLALVAEERESVRVERLRHAVAQERGLEHGVVFEQVLAFADTMRRDLARGIVKREDDALVRAVGSPDVSWRRVVLVDLSVRLGLPATIAVVRPLALDRERAAHERHEVLLAELPDARAVAHEFVFARQLVGVELEVRAVVLRRLDERLQLLDARRRPGRLAVAARRTEEGRLLACGKPLRPEVVDLSAADAEGSHGLLHRQFTVVESSDDALDRFGRESRIELLVLHPAIISTSRATCKRETFTMARHSGSSASALRAAPAGTAFSPLYRAIAGAWTTHQQNPSGDQS